MHPACFGVHQSGQSVQVGGLELAQLTVTQGFGRHGAGVFEGFQHRCIGGIAGLGALGRRQFKLAQSCRRQQSLIGLHLLGDSARWDAVAPALAARLRDFSPDVIWSSRELKAVETADIVAGVLGVPVRIADGLEEHHRSNVPYFPTMDEFESAVEQLFCNPDQLVLGTETAGQASGPACRIRRRGKAGRRCWKDRAATPPSIGPTALEWPCAGCSC